MTKKGRYGKYGGQYASETLMSALIELENAYAKVRGSIVKRMMPVRMVSSSPICRSRSQKRFAPLHRSVILTLYS